MKLRSAASPFLLLLLPAVASALGDVVVTPSLDTKDHAQKQHEPVKDLPVDGKDGRPHSGPFVETDGKTGDVQPLEGKPDDPTVVDGKKIPDSIDGVMSDKNREHALEGQTGLEGGVSEKSKAKQDEEGRTGEKAVAQPESPKEQPAVPPSEEENLRPTKPKPKPEEDQEGDAAFTGLDKPKDLPDTPHGQAVPVPDTTSENPLDSSKSNADASIPASIPHHDDDDGIIQPFHSFVLSFTMILFSEIGDKTFLVAALMAMKHDRMVVFTAAFGALLVMTVLSAVLGHTVPALIPKHLTSFLAAILFFVFGAKLLREGMQMDPNEGVTAEMHEVEQELAEKEKEMGRKRGNSVSPYTLEMGIETRRSRNSKRLKSPPRSPSQSPVRDGVDGPSALSSLLQGANNLFSLLLSPAWVQTFVMTFLGEWGDRSQIATIAMAAGQDYWWVTLGATAGHAICTGVAVIGGRAIAGRVSLKVVTIGGAVAFLVFGVIYLIEALYN